MAENVLTTMFVVPTGNTLPTGSNSTNTLTSGQFGIFLPDNTPATVGNVGSARYIYFAQGRNVYSGYEGSKKSDWIQASNIINWYKVTGNLQQSTQVTEITSLTAGCQQDISITLRLDSYYIRAAYNNGLTRSVMVTTPCCDCGGNPCDSLGASDTQTTMSQLAQAINSDEILSLYVTAGTNGTGLSTSIWIQGKALQEYGQGTSVDLTNFPYQFDRMSFWTFVTNGPVLTTDYEVIDACDTVATVVILQRSSYPINTPAEVRQLEKDNFSYQAQYGHLFENVNFNGEYQTYVDSTSAYNLYYLNYFEPVVGGRDIGVTRKDEWSLIAIPKGDASEAGTVAILTAFLGTANNSIATPSTTSTYTTSSTTTTTSTNTTP